MKNRAFRKFVASIGVAAMVMSTATNALSPAVTKAESAQELEGQQNDSQEQGGQEDPVAQSSDDANGAPFADAEPMAVSSDDSQNSQEAVGPSESSDSNGENGAEGSSGENTNASAGSTSTDASGAESQGAAGTMSGATNGTAGTMSGATNATSANGTSANTSTDAANGTSTGASTGTTTGENGEASGDNAEASTKEITSVITEDIDLGTYPAGEAPAYAQLELPDEIEVKVDEEKQIVTVTWNGEETYHPDQAGTYIFSSELDKEWNKDENGNARYQLAEKVELPKASVRVEKKAESKEENKTDVKSDNKTENKTDAKLDNKADSKTDAKADNKSEGKTEEKSDSKSEVTTKPETTKDTSKETAKDTSKENTKETSKKDSTSKDETKGETKDKTKDDTKAETKTDTKDESAKADQKKKVTNAASLKAVYVAEDGTILCGTVGLTGDTFTISDKAKSFNGYELKTVTLGEEELPQDTAFTRNTSTTETKEEIRTEASYTYTMDGAEHEIAAGDTATITFTYAQKEEVTPEIASIEVTGEAVDTTGAAIQGDYAFPLAVGTNDLSKTAPYIQGYEYQYAEIGTDKITSIAKEVLEAGKYAYYVDGELLKENTRITYVYQEDEDYTEQLSADCGDVSVTLSATKDAKIPKNAKLVVNAITGDRLRSALSMSADAMGVTADKVYGTAYDIYLEADGNRIQPSEHVHVTMSFHNPVSLNLPDKAQVAKSAVIHIHDGQANAIVGNAQTDGSNVTGANFNTDRFSIFNIALLVSDYQSQENHYKISTDLAQFLSSVTIEGATKNEDGSYSLYPGTEYKFGLNFEEEDKINGYQFDDAGPLTFALPQGFEAITTHGSCDISCKDADGNSYLVSGNMWKIENGKLVFNWNVNDENFGVLKAAANTEFKIYLQGKVAENATEIKWGDKAETKITIDTSNKVSVKKEGNLDLANDTINYVITITSTGISKNVVVSDEITGTALTYNKDARLSVDRWNPQSSDKKIPNGTEKGFSYTIPEMKNGEQLYIFYSAHIDRSKISDNGTVEQTGNKISVKSDGQPKPSEDNNDFEHKIDYTPDLKKEAGNPEDVVDGYRQIPYTITFNEKCLTSVAGKTITDTIASDSQSRMGYSGDVKISVYDHNGLVTTRTQSIPKGNKSWSYTIPTDDVQAYKYVFQYNAKVKVDDLLTNTTVTNEASDGSQKVKKESNVGPDEQQKAGVKKEAISVTSTKIIWKISLTVPANGLTKASVEDTLPVSQGWYPEQYKDIYENSSLKIENDENDKFKINTDDPSKVIIDFPDGIKSTGQQRTIVITLTTNVNQNWLKKHENWDQKHINNVNFIANDIEYKCAAEAIPSIPEVEKQYIEPYEIDGLPVYKYQLLLKGVTEKIFNVTDSFPTQFLEYYNSSTYMATIYGGDENHQGYDCGSVTASNTKQGATLSVSLNDEPSKYGCYRITYYLKVKDLDALRKLQEESLKTDKKSYCLTNTAYFGKSSDSANVEYTYDPLNKELINGNTINGTNNVAKFRLTINPSAQRLNDGKSYTLTDVYTNLAVDYTSIKITTNPQNKIEYNFNGNTGTFIIPDNTAVTIEYDAKVIGSGNVEFTNTAEIFNKSKKVSKTVNVSGGGSGTSSVTSIKILKYEEGHMETTLPEAKFGLYVDEQNGQEPIFLDYITTQKGGVATIKGSTDSNGWKLHPKTRYYLVEKEAPSGYKLNPNKYYFTIMDQPNYDNHVYYSGDTIKIADEPAGNLKLEKKIGDGSPASAKDKTYQFTVKTSDEKYVHSDGTFSDQEVTIDVKPGTPVMISDLPVGEYTVAEKTSDETQIVGYTLTVSGGGTAAVSKGETATAEITNKYTKDKGSLKLEKKIGDGSPASAKDKTYQFTVKTSDGKYVHSDGTFSDQEVTIDVKPGTPVMISDLPVGEYTVAEKTSDETQIVGYTLTVSGGGTAAVSKGETATAEITNTYTKDKGSLKLEKKIGDGSPASAKDKTYQFTVKTSDGKYVHSDGTFSDQEVTIDVKPGTPVMISDLPVGEYTVAEKTSDETQIVGYTLTVSGGGTAAVSKGETATAEITNKYTKDKGSLKLEKKIGDGSPASAKDKTYQFTVKTSDGKYVHSDGTFSDQEVTIDVKPGTPVMISDLPVGEYTVAEKTSDETQIVGYTLTVSGGGTAAVSKGETATAEITNTYTKDKGSLKLEKKIGDGSPASAKDKTYQFTVKTSDGKYVHSDGTFSDQEETIAVKPGTPVTINNLPVGAYTVAEKTSDATQISGYTLTVSGEGTATVSKGQTATATITNTYTKDKGSLKLEKQIGDGSPDSAKDKTYQFTVKTSDGKSVKIDGSFSDQEETIAVKPGTPVTISDLPVGAYTVAEKTSDETQIVGYTLTVSGGGTATVSKGETATAEITNTYTKDKGSLKLEKQIGDGSPDSAKDKTYQFTVKTSDGKSVKIDGSFSDQEETIAVKPGTPVTINNLPVGEYTVAEKTSDATQISGYTLTVSGGGTAAVSKGQTATATITNTYTKDKGSLKLEKQIGDGSPDSAKDKTYQFTVKTSDGKSVKIDGTFSDQEETIAVKPGTPVTINNLPVGEYTVAEKTSDATQISGYTLTVSGGGTAAVSKGQTATATITNTYTKDKGSLKLEKQIGDGSPDSAKDKTYQFTVKTSDGKSVKIDGSFSDQEETIAVKPGTPVTISDLPVGAYTVAEKTSDETQIVGYTLTVSGGGTATVSKGETATAEITNTYTKDKGSLKLEKQIGDGSPDSAKDKTYQFTVKTSDGKSVKIDGSFSDQEVTIDVKPGTPVTINNLPVGEYTVAEKTSDATQISGYTLTVSGEGTATVSKGQTATATITNTYTKDKGSLKLEKQIGDGSPDSAKDKTYQFTVKTSDGKSVKIDGSFSDQEETIAVKPGTPVTINNLPVGEYTVAEKTSDATQISGYTLTVSGEGTATVSKGQTATATITNTYTKDKGSLKLEKQIGDGSPDSAKDKTYQFTVKTSDGKSVKIDGSFSDQEVTIDVKPGTPVTISDLPVGAYTVAEKTSDETQIVGYTLTVSGGGTATVSKGETATATIRNTYAEIKTEVSGIKTWKDADNQDGRRPEKITVNLFADGTKVASQKITEANGWKYEFKDLPKYNNGTEIKYTITEDAVEGYTSSINGFNITNTYTPEKVQVSGSKNWNDDGNAAGTRPGSITIRLYANGSEIGHKTVTEKDGWSWNWTGLNRYDTDHKEISYTISEDAVDGYTTSISGYNVTNTVNKPQVGSVILTKVDATTGTALAGAVFDLYRANNTKVGTYTTNAGGVLRVDGLTFGDYYFVETKAPEGYALESQRAAFTINAATTVSAPASVRVTNKPVDEKIGVSAAKVWDDENNTDGVRPSSVTFRLFADGVEIGSAQASEANGWTVSFGNLPKTRNGAAISYAVKEDEVGNYYEASYETGLGSDGSYVFTVKNYRETDKHYEERTGSVRGANRNKPSNGGVAGAGRGRGTGDESDMTVYGTVSGASLLALIVWMIARRKRAGKGTK